LFRAAAFTTETIEMAFTRIVQAETGCRAQIENARFLGVFQHFYAGNRYGEHGYGTHANMPIPKCTFEALTCAQIFMNLKGPCITWELISLPGALFLERNKRAARPANNSALDRRSADSDEAGHAFQSEAGHLFRSEAGRGSDLMSATLRRAAAGRWDDVFLWLLGQADGSGMRRLRMLSPASSIL
jgi:hypothetical protein